MNKIRITVWSDYVCPFCYLEAPVLNRLREEYGELLEVDWRAFELRPEPVPTLDPEGDYLQRVWNAAVYPMAEERGLKIKLPPVQPRSRRAMELAELARQKGKFDAVHEALFCAFFQDGKDLDGLDVLVDIGVAAGLESAEVLQALQAGRYRSQVLEDERQAAQLGLHGVPALLVRREDEPLGKWETLSGAQPYEAVRAAVERAITRT
jgi:predicted DsbA family dithiol-disulfide isomerase